METYKKELKAAQEAILKTLQVPPEYLMSWGPKGSKAVVESPNQGNLSNTSEFLSKNDIESYFNN